MGLLDRLFEKEQKDSDFWNVFFSHAVAGYRRYAAVHRCAPGPNVSDAEIIQVYKRVEAAFQEVARGRGGRLDVDVVQNIVLFFLQKYQMIGQANPVFFAQHIAYETEKFRREGLRSEYNRALSLTWEEPLWHKEIPVELSSQAPS